MGIYYYVIRPALFHFYIAITVAQILRKNPVFLFSFLFFANKLSPFVLVLHQ